MENEEWSFTPFWGSYEMQAERMVWHHNPNLKMTRLEQFDANARNHKDFYTVKRFAPAIRIVN